MSEMTDRQRLMLSLTGALLLLAACVGAVGLIVGGVARDVATVRASMAGITVPAHTVTGIVGAVRY